jgi:5-methylcytosine-specific restriction endonuclease McrA
MSWQRIRQQVLERDNNQCQICQLNANKLDIHHIIPLRKNGLNSLYNLVAVCRKCHTIIELDPPSKGMNMVKLIKVDNDIHERLTKRGQKNETYSDIIRKLLDIVEGKTKK